MYVVVWTRQPTGTELVHDTWLECQISVLVGLTTLDTGSIILRSLHQGVLILEYQLKFFLPEFLTK